jgi:hypothetical protein
LHVLLREMAAAATLSPYLRALDIIAEPPRHIVPTLEDVFVHLVSLREQAGERA